MKFIFISIRKNILPLIFIIFTICLVVFSKSNLTATKNGLTLWATCVVPSLFPFFVITNLLSHTKIVSFIGRLLDRFMRPLFNVPGIGGFAFIMGLISGYPVGAKIVSDFRDNNLVSKDEGERLLAFTNNSGPLFIISSVGISLLGDTKTGMLLLFTHILSCITVGIILGNFSKTSNYEYIQTNSYYNKKENKDISNVTLKNLGEVLGNSISNSISTLLLIGGFVVIFSVLISILNQTHIIEILAQFFKPILGFLGFDLNFAKPLVSGILELTNGVSLVSDVHVKAISQNIVLCAFLLGFGGLSVLLQVFSIVSKTDLSMKKYFIGKLLQGFTAALYTFLALKFIPFLNLDIVETANYSTSSINSVTNFLHSYFYNLGIFTIAVLVLFIIYNIFKLLYKKILN